MPPTAPSGARLPSLPVLCYVTDRRRLAARLGAPPDAPAVGLALETRIVEAARAGVTLIQVREPDLLAGRLFELVTHVVSAVHASGALLVVNDRLDVALSAGADGVHLRESSMPAEAVRRLAPDALVGRSIHRTPAGDEEAVLDYLVFGTVFPTASKPASARTAGSEGLQSAVAASKRPVLAIGGVCLANVAAIARTGCAGVAAVDLFQAADDFTQLHEIVVQVRRAFDTAEVVS